MEEDYIKVKDRKDLVRDRKSTAILNTDNAALNKYRSERDFQMKVITAVEGYEKLSEEIGGIKSMLQELLKKSK